MSASAARSPVTTETPSPPPLDPPEAGVPVVRARLPKGVLLRFGILVLLVAAGFALARWSPLAEYLDRERLLALFEDLRGFWWTPVLMLALYTALSAVGMPISPLVVCGGAFYGVLYGTLLNTLGLFLGSAASYQLARSLGRDFVVHFAGERLKKAESLFDKSGFLPLIQVRFLPVPFSLVNFGAALAGVKAVPFLLATAIGLLPMTLLHTFFAARFAALAEKGAGQEEWMWLGAIYLGSWGLFALVMVGPSVLGAWRRRQRYRRLVAERRRLSDRRRPSS